MEQTTWYKMLSFLSWCTCKITLLFLHMKWFIDRSVGAMVFGPPCMSVWCQINGVQDYRLQHGLHSVIFVLIYFSVLVLAFQLYFSFHHFFVLVLVLPIIFGFSFVLVLQYFFVLVLVLRVIFSFSFVPEDMLMICLNAVHGFNAVRP